MYNNVSVLFVKSLKMNERLKYQQIEFKTSEVAKQWTEKSPNSKLSSFNKTLSNPKIKNIKEVSSIFNLIKSREYRQIQKVVGVPYNKCDGKLWNESFLYFKNYINKFASIQWRLVNTNNNLSRLQTHIQENIWHITNVVDTVRIDKNSNQYLANNETLSIDSYNKLFSWKERIQQWQLGDCYLVSWIHELSRAQHFDTLMRTSIQRVSWNNWDQWYQIKIPFWEPSWRKILIKDREISIAKIKWNIDINY